MLTGKQTAKDREEVVDGEGDDTAPQRAYNVAAASHRSLRICNDETLSNGRIISVLVAYGG